MIRPILALCALTVFVSCLTACGQKGPLVPAPKGNLTHSTAQAAAQ